MVQSLFELCLKCFDPGCRNYILNTYGLTESYLQVLAAKSWPEHNQWDIELVKNMMPQRYCAYMEWSLQKARESCRLFDKAIHRYTNVLTKVKPETNSTYYIVQTEFKTTLKRIMCDAINKPGSLLDVLWGITVVMLSGSRNTSVLFVRNADGLSTRHAGKLQKISSEFQTETEEDLILLANKLKK